MIPTVRVVSPVSDDNPHGFIVINEADLTDEHELFDKPAPVEPAPVEKPKLTLKA